MTTTPEAQQEPEWLHLKAYGYAPGSYMGKCHTCRQIVCDIDKRAITCRPCAEKAFTARSLQAAPALQPPSPQPSNHNLATPLLDSGWRPISEAEQRELREHRELAKLAYRALDDAAQVLFLLDPESDDEAKRLQELTKRCADLAVSIFTITRLPPGAMPYVARAMDRIPAALDGGER